MLHPSRRLGGYLWEESRQELRVAVLLFLQCCISLKIPGANMAKYKPTKYGWWMRGWSNFFFVCLEIACFKKWNSWFQVALLSNPYKKLLIYLLIEKKRNTVNLSSKIPDWIPDCPYFKKHYFKNIRIYIEFYLLTMEKDHKRSEAFKTWNFDM